MHVLERSRQAREEVVWLEEAHLCRLANRNLSAAEWQQYMGLNVPYRRTCPDLPPGEGVPAK